MRSARHFREQLESLTKSTEYTQGLHDAQEGERQAELREERAERNDIAQAEAEAAADDAERRAQNWRFQQQTAPLNRVVPALG